jgi:WD40 repeat protein
MCRTSLLWCVTGCLLLTCTAAADPPRTDCHGDPLPPGAVARFGTTRLRTGASHVAYSPDGKVLASVSRQAIVLWDPKSGKEIRRLGAERGIGATSLAFAPAGKLLATWSADRNGTIRIWESDTGKELHEIVATNNIDGLAFSADGKQIFAGSSKGRVYRWEVETAKPLEAFSGGRFRVEGLAVSPDGKLLAGYDRSNGNDGRIIIWNGSSGNIIQTLAHASDFPGVTLAFFADNNRLVATSGYQPARLWDVSRGKEIRLFGPSSFSVAASPDGKAVAVGGDGQVRCWDATTGKELGRMRIRPSFSASLSFAPDGKVLAVACDSSIRLWDLVHGQEVFPNRGSETALSCVAASADGKVFVTGGRDAHVRLWDRTGKELRRLEASGYPVNTVALAPVGNAVAAGSFDGTIQLWDRDSGELLRSLRGNGKQVHALAFTPDGKALVSGDDERIVRLWDVATGKEIRQFLAGTSVQSVALSHDGKLLAFMDQKARLWEVKTGEELLRWSLGRQGSFVAFGPDDATLCAGSGGDMTNSVIVFWDVQSGREVQRWRLPTGEVARCFALSADGRTLAVGADPFVRGEQGTAHRPTVTLWEVRTGQARRRLASDQAGLRGLAFAPDGTLVSVGENTTGLLWEGIAPAGGPPGRDRLTPQGVQERWSVLGARDAALAYDAACDLARSPRATLALVQKALAPVRTADPKRLARLIGDLQSDRFAVRDAAAQELEDLAEAAGPALRAARDEPLSLEARRRLESVLEKLDTLSAKRLRSLRALEVLEAIGTAEARRLVETLAGGIAEARLTQEAQATLRRLDRRSAKHAPG